MDRRIISIEPIPTRQDGNALWHVVADDGGYIVRKRLRTDTDPDTEASILKHAAHLGITPEVTGYERGDTLVQRYVEGEHRTSLTSVDLTALADTLRTLHADAYRDAHWPTIDLSALIEPDTAEVKEAFTAITHFPATPALCHNDLNPRNILWRDGQVWLIDFEYAGLNDPCFDLAAVSVEFGFSDELERMWMEAYWGEEVWKERKLAAYKVLYRALWRQWEAKQI